MEELIVTNPYLYLAYLGPVFVVMGIAIAALWARVLKLEDRQHQRDLDNLETLQNLATVLGEVRVDGSKHFAELKSHVDDRTRELKEVIKSYS